jgi:hypothetical protein
MSYNYHDLLAAVAMRVNALDGTDAAQLQVTYSARPLTNEMFQSSIFPMNAIRDSILNAEQKLCQAIGKSADRVLRSYIGSQTVGLVSGDELPTLDENGDPIIGDFGAVIDAANPAILCTRMPLKVVERRNLSPATWLLGGAMYALDGTRIIHTQDEVVMECCIYDVVTQEGAFDANQQILLPDVLAEAYINGALAMLVRDDEFTQQAQIFASYFATTLANFAPATMEAQPV